MEKNNMQKYIHQYKNGINMREERLMNEYRAKYIVIPPWKDENGVLTDQEQLSSEKINYVSKLALEDEEE